MPRKRDYRAEYQRRMARARELGLTNAQAHGHAKRRNLPTVRELQRSGRIPKLPPAPSPRRRPKVVTTPAATIVTSTDARVWRAQLRAAAAAGKRVAVYVNVDAGDGRGPRTHVVDGRAYGYGREVDADTASLVGKPQLVIGDKGIPAGDVLDVLDGNDGDVEATAFELWAEPDSWGGS